MNRLHDLLHVFPYYLTQKRIDEYATLLDLGIRRGYEFYTV